MRFLNYIYKMKRIVIIFFLLILVNINFAEGQYCRWFVFISGAQQISSGNYKLYPSVGEMGIGHNLESSSYKADIGYLSILIPSLEEIGTPTNLVATCLSVGLVKLTWQDNSDNEEGFVVMHSEDNTTFATLTTLPPNTQYYNDYIKPYKSPITYYYKVAAYRAGTYSYSNVATVPVTHTRKFTILHFRASS